MEYEADSVEIRRPNPSFETKELRCPHCDRNLTADGQQPSVAVKTASYAAAEVPNVGTSSSKGDLVLVPRDQLATMQKYYLAVKDAYFNYSLTDGDSAEVVRRLFEHTPEVLSSANQQGRSPIECALAQRRWTAGAQLLDLAGRRNQRALRHRTAAGEDALMLAVAGDNEAAVRQLLSQRCGRDACLHYDVMGRSCLHLCALGGSATALEVLLAELADLLDRDQLTSDSVTEALDTSDRDGCTPLHYMARGNHVAMLRAVHNFSNGGPVQPDWDARQTSGDLRPTPLAMAAEADALDACEFLLQSGLAGIDLHDQRDLWMQAALSDSARALLGQHCRLMKLMTALPPDSLVKLQDGLQERGLTEEFLLRLRARWPDLPQLPRVVNVLAACQNFSGSCRLVVWDILQDLGTVDLAQLLEA